MTDDKKLLVENILLLSGTEVRKCMKCGKFYDADYVFGSEGVPKCSCGGVIKPDVVLYQEALDEDTVDGAIRAIKDAETLIVAGTSLTVYPAASFIRYFKGNDLIIINRDPTPQDGSFDLVIHDSVGKVLSKINL